MALIIPEAAGKSNANPITLAADPKSNGRLVMVLLQKARVIYISPSTG